MKWFPTQIVVFLLGVGLLAGCGAGANTPPATPTPDSPVLFSINDTVVTRADFERRLEETLGPILTQMRMQGQSEEEINALADEQNVRQSILDEMIQQELLTRIAREEGLGVDAAEIDAQIEQRKQFAGMGGVAGGQGAEATEMTAEEEAALREELTQQQLVLQVVAKHTTADMFNSRHILVEDEKTANEVLEKLKAGADFAELAAEYSTDPGSKDKGGSYGWVARGNFVPEYEEAAFTAELNTPVIVKSQFGFHVIVVEDRQENRPYDSIEQLRQSGSAQQHFEQTFLPWYERIRKAAEEDGTLVINTDVDISSIPLPFPSEVPTMPAMPESMPDVTIEELEPTPTP